MKASAVLVIVFVCCGICLAGEPSAGVAEPSARELLGGVWSCFPSEPVVISGDLIVRGRRGSEPGLRLELEADWSGDPVRAVYTIRNADGITLERMTVTRRGQGTPQYAYERGDPLKPESTPDLAATIGRTDISWMDLTLSFLWWPNPEVAGTDKVRGRECHVVSVRPPEGTGGQYGHVLLWIDRELGMFLQAEGYDPAGERVRRLWIQSLKKIDERWMIKDLEVQVYPGTDRTKLLVRSLKVGGSETLEQGAPEEDHE